MTSRGSTASSRTMCPIEKMHFKMEFVHEMESVISGVANQEAPYRWTSWEAAHILPLEKESLWTESNYGVRIADMDGTIGASKINSLRNGFLLRQHIFGKGRWPKRDLSWSCLQD